MRNPSTSRHSNQIEPEIAVLILETPRMAAEIAALANVDRSYVSHILHGRRPPSRKLRAALVEVLRQRARRYDSASYHAACSHLAEPALGRE